MLVYLDFYVNNNYFKREKLRVKLNESCDEPFYDEPIYLAAYDQTYFNQTYPTAALVHSVKFKYINDRYECNNPNVFIGKDETLIWMDNIIELKKEKINNRFEILDL